MHTRENEERVRQARAHLDAALAKVCWPLPADVASDIVDDVSRAADTLQSVLKSVAEKLAADKAAADKAAAERKLANTAAA